MWTRRHFLGTLLTSLPVMSLPAWPDAFRASPTRASATSLDLFFRAVDRDALARRFATDPRFDSLRDTLSATDRPAAWQFIQQEVRLNDHLYDIKRLHDLAPEQAFVYAMTGDEDAADLAAAAVRAIMRFPKWDYFLDGPGDDRVLGLQRAAGCVVAVACTADWLGDYLSEEERADWLRTMGERGCEACYRSVHGMRAPETTQGWRIDPDSTYLQHRPDDRDLSLANWPTILDRTNLKAVPASALAIGAVAYEQQFGQDATTDRWVEQAVYSVRSFGDLFARDGSYDEGISYANYTAQHLIQAAEVLARHRALDLYDLINWPGFVDYVLGLSLPTTDDAHAVVNFGDAGTGLRSDVAYWIAGRAGDARAQWFGDERAYAHTLWSVLWHDEAVPASPPPHEPHVWHSDLDWITARTGHGPDDLVVAMRSGPPSNHEHGDRNSLVVKAFGDVLVADPYRPTYNNDDPGWWMRHTEGHSALLIDGQGHQYHDGSEGTNASDAHARIIRKGERSGYSFWASDAGDAYRLVLPHVEAVTRTVVVLYDVPAVLVLDKVVTDGTPVRLQARYYGDGRHGDCTMQAGEASFRIARPHAELQAFGFSRQGVAARQGRPPLPPDQAALHPFADLATDTPDTAPLLVSTLLPTPKGSSTPTVTRRADGSLLIARRDQQTTVKWVDTGRLPEVHVTFA